MMADGVRRLVVVLGDQLDRDSRVFDGFDPERDAILMMEAREEAAYLRQHKKRLVLFFAAMRHFAEAQRAEGRRVLYRRFDDDAPCESLAEGLRAAIGAHAPERALVVRPGDWRVLEALKAAGGALLELVEDGHFLSSPEEFSSLREGRKRFILEDYYRALRKRTGWLMTEDGPEGGAWNFDKDNRKSFGRAGPGLIPERPRFEPDGITRDVMRGVARIFPDAPGAVSGFAEAVTRAQALTALAAFIADRLRDFGDHQDAMATGRRTLNHSRLSAAMNLKLISPAEACLAALDAYEAGAAPLNAVEGFIRQILGWREFARGIYWTLMPEYAGRNGLDAAAEVPGFFWTGETEMACLADGIGGLVEEGYAHHIQRLMVMGLFLMLFGARPLRVHEWHMEMYLDAVDWVSLPNVLGMSQHADGAVMGTKPYCASGAYIDRMSDHCAGCRFDPKRSEGEGACPFTVLYWDFLARHREPFGRNMRMKMQVRNLDRKGAGEILAIRRAAEALRGGLG